MATVKYNLKRFRDIDLSFTVNPFTKDLYLKKDEDAIKTALKHLILTQNFERPFHPEIGTQINSLLFEPYSPAVRIALEKTISDAILKFEPRIELLDISIIEKADNNDLEVSITFRYQGTDLPVTLTTVLSRVR